MELLAHFELVQHFLSTEGQASLMEKLIIVAVVWFTMGRKVSIRFQEMKRDTNKTINEAMDALKSHLLIVEKKFDDVVGEMSETRKVLSADLEANTRRMEKIEQLWIELSERVGRLENNKQGEK